jgi:hypothetical protein
MPSHGDGVAIGGVSGSTRDRTNAKVGTSGGYFGGRVGEFAAWNHAHTASQIASDSQSDLQGSGTTLNDSTPNRLNATISGASWTTQ